MDWFYLLAVQGTLKSLLQHHSSLEYFIVSELSYCVQQEIQALELPLQHFWSQVSFQTFFFSLNSALVNGLFVSRIFYITKIVHFHMVLFSSGISSNSCLLFPYVLIFLLWILIFFVFLVNLFFSSNRLSAEMSRTVGSTDFLRLQEAKSLTAWLLEGDCCIQILFSNLHLLAV